MKKATNERNTAYKQMKEFPTLENKTDFEIKKIAAKLVFKN